MLEDPRRGRLEVVDAGGETRPDRSERFADGLEILVDRTHRGDQVGDHPTHPHR